MKNVSILNFSSRNFGNCGSIAAQIASRCSNANVCTYQISDMTQPCGGCSYECLKPDVSCSVSEAFRTMMDRLMSSDRIYYVVPNICGFPGANYFIFNERTMGYFDGNRALMGQFLSIPKQFVIVSNTESDVFYKAMQQQAKEPQILYLKTGKYRKNSLAGDILDSEEALADLDAFLGL